MYHFVVRRIVQNGYRELSKGNYEAVIRQFAPDVKFQFYGDHALGATLNDADAVRAWFRRAYAIFPGLQFTPQQIIVSGFPWDTRVAAQFTVSAMLRDGEPYQNTVAQFLRLKWGRVVEDYVLEDTQKLVGVLERMAQNGISQALAQPMFS